MNNIAVLQIILPLIAGFTVAFFNKKIKISRFLTKLFMTINLIIVIYMTYLVFQNGAIILEAGNWVSTYGIVFVDDNFSIIFVLTKNILVISTAFISPYFIYHTKQYVY